jgi:hypothetical protein
MARPHPGASVLSTITFTYRKFTMRYDRSIKRALTIGVLLAGMVTAHLFGVIVPAQPASATCSVPYVFSFGEILSSSQVNTDFSTLAACSNTPNTASAIIPTNTSQAVFGGSFDYTMPVGLKIGGPGGERLSSGTSSPSGSCNVGDQYVNTAATGFASLIFSCFPANTWIPSSGLALSGLAAQTALLALPPGNHKLVCAGDSTTLGANGSGGFVATPMCTLIATYLSALTGYTWTPENLGASGTSLEHSGARTDGIDSWNAGGNVLSYATADPQSIFIFGWGANDAGEASIYGFTPAAFATDYNTVVSGVIAAGVPASNIILWGPGYIDPTQSKSPTYVMAQNLYVPTWNAYAEQTARVAQSGGGTGSPTRYVNMWNVEAANCGSAGLYDGEHPKQPCVNVMATALETAAFNEIAPSIESSKSLAALSAIDANGCGTLSLAYVYIDQCSTTTKTVNGILDANLGVVIPSGHGISLAAGTALFSLDGNETILKEVGTGGALIENSSGTVVGTFNHGGGASSAYWVANGPWGTAQFAFTNSAGGSDRTTLLSSGTSTQGVLGDVLAVNGNGLGTPQVFAIKDTGDAGILGTVYAGGFNGPAGGLTSIPANQFAASSFTTGSCAQASSATALGSSVLPCFKAYKANGTVVASTVHCVTDSVTAAGASTSVTLTAPAAFASATYPLTVVDMTTFAAAAITAQSATAFTFTSTSTHVYAFSACAP